MNIRPRMLGILLVPLAGAAGLLLFPREALQAQNLPHQFGYLSNGTVKIGVDLRAGGSIAFLADARNSRNIINIHDYGRYLGQSYYSGPHPFGNPHPKWQDWAWNPVSAGDVYNHPARVLRYANDGKTLYVKSRPMQWALNNVPGDCDFETWIRLEGNAARVWNRLTNMRRDKAAYPAHDQEVPALYTVGTVHRLFTYDGDQPFTNAPLRQIQSYNVRPWATWYASENWAALVGNNGWGVGILAPGSYVFKGGFRGKLGQGGATDDPCGYIAPIRSEILDHNIVYSYEYTLVLGNLKDIRAYCYQHRSPKGLPDYRFNEDREHWRFVRATDQGWHVKDHLRVKIDAAAPQILGPDGWWRASEVPKLYINGAFHLKRALLELSWRTPKSSLIPGNVGKEFPPDCKIRVPVKNDGQFRTYEVDLASLPAYKGVIAGLRLNPVGGGPGDRMDLAFVSWKNHENTKAVERKTAAAPTPPAGK